MNFIEMGIPVRSTLKYKENDKSVTIAEEKKVNYNDTVCSLTAATREIMGLEYSVQPAPHWSYEGRSLKEFNIHAQRTWNCINPLEGGFGTYFYVKSI